MQGKIKESNDSKNLNDTLKWLSNLVKGALPSTEGFGEIIITESGKYVGIEFDDKTTSRKVHH